MSDAEQANISVGDVSASAGADAPGVFDAWADDLDELPIAEREANSAALWEAMMKLPGTVTPTTASMLQATENNFREVEREFEMLDATGLAVLLGATSAPELLAADLRKREKVLSIPRLGSFVYPGFQVDTVHGVVKPVISPLIALGKKYGWTPPDIAMWLTDGTGYLPEYGRPVDVIDDADLVFKVAQDEWSVEW